MNKCYLFINFLPLVACVIMLLTYRLVKPTERYIALSNMPEESQATNLPSNGLTTVTFQKSVPMVTYLACFIVCDFEYQVKKNL